MKPSEEQALLQDQALDLLDEVTRTLDQDGDPSEEGEEKYINAQKLIAQSEKLSEEVRKETQRIQIRIWSRVGLTALAVLGTIYLFVSSKL